MPRASDRFLAALALSHEVISYVDVTSPSNQTVRLETVDGNITVDRTVEYRRGGTVNCIDSTGTLTVQGAEGILTPLGTEVRPYRGIVYEDGTTEVYALGVFRISQATVSETVGTADGSYGVGSGGGAPAAGSIPTGCVQIAISMYDRSRKVARDLFTATYSIAAGTNALTAIKAILARSFPDLTYDAVGTTLTVPSTLVYAIGDDPWAACQDLATSMGCEVYFDVDGDVVIAPPPDINSLGAAAMTYVEGDGCSMTGLDAVYTDSPGYNGVIVIGQSPANTTAPVIGVAWDTEPSSPTYWLGPYGKVPQIVNDSTITTQADAQASATNLLNGQLGFSAQISVTAYVNPALEAGDVIAVQRLALGVDGFYSLDTLNVPLINTETQALSGRSQRTVS